MIEINLMFVRLLIISFIAVIVLSNFASAQRNELMDAYVYQGKDARSLQGDLLSKSLVLVDACAESLALTDQQKDRLKLACKGDVVRLMQELTEVEVHTRGIKMQEIQRNQEEMQKLWPILMPPRQRIDEGLHGKGSLFERALAGMLTPEQRELFEKQNQQKADRLTIALAKLTLSEFEKSVPLTKKQRDAIVDLVQKSPKPKKINDGMSYYIGMMILAKLPDADVKKILSEDQFKIFKRTFQNAQNFGGIEW
ncbi:MAG: hypothetical protein U0930_22050 [Pirellulales bacterium]